MYTSEQIVEYHGVVFIVFVVVYIKTTLMFVHSSTYKQAERWPCYGNKVIVKSASVKIMAFLVYNF